MALGHQPLLLFAAVGTTSASNDRLADRASAKLASMELVEIGSAWRAGAPSTRLA